MAPGIYKTFRKVWNNNVKKAIEFGLINSDINMSIKTSKQLNYDKRVPLLLPYDECKEYISESEYKSLQDLLN